MPDPPQSNIEIRRAQSIGDVGARMDIRIFDSTGDEAIVAISLYRRLWQLEQWIRALPRKLVHVVPVRETELNFDIGDLVSVRAGPKARGGFTGAQRIYEFTLSWDENGTRELGELVTSDTQEGI
jgi:hypothetical protein